MQADGQRPNALRVDGGMVANDWLMQFLADMLGSPVERPIVTETTALGAAYLAALQSGVFASLGDIEALWKCEQRFDAAMTKDERDGFYTGWEMAVARVRTA
jgi:glycerol kinase